MLGYVEIILLIYFTLSLLWSYALMFGAWRMLRNPDQLGEIEGDPLVSILVPAFNEQDVILASVQQMLMSHHENVEVCICDDHSTDDTSKLLIDRYEMTQEVPDSRIWASPDGRVKLFVAAVNRGRAGALNCALTMAEGEYCIATDADTILDHAGVLKMIQSIESGNHDAIGGTLLLANEVKHHPMGLDWIPQISKSWIAGTQAVEYLRAFLYGRLGLNKLGGNVIVSGAFGLFRTETVRELGGWNEKTVAEDFDFTTRVREAGGSVRFVPDPVAYTQAPPDIQSLGNQRSRWHRGLTEIFFRGPGRANMFKNGWLGKFVLPVHFFVEWLAPFFELAGLMILVSYVSSGDVGILLAPILIVGYLANVLLSLISLKFEKDNFNRYRGSYERGIGYAFAEPFWYRPLMLLWRLRGLMEYITGKKGWGGLIQRKAFGMTAVLLLMATPTKADWVELSHTTEAGQVQERHDTTLMYSNGELTASVKQRDRDGLRDHEGLVSYYTPLVSRLSLLSSAHVSNHGVIFARSGYGLKASWVEGSWVGHLGFTQEFFQSGVDIEFLSVQLDYYRGHWRYAARLSNALGEDMWSHTLYTQRITPNLNWITYASEGEEVLDIPLLVGYNWTVGTQARTPLSGPVEGSLGFSLGERDGRRYATYSIGVRVDF